MLLNCIIKQSSIKALLIFFEHETIKKSVFITYLCGYHHSQNSDNRCIMKLWTQSHGLTSKAPLKLHLSWLVLSRGITTESTGIVGLYFAINLKSTHNIFRSSKMFRKKWGCQMGNDVSYQSNMLRWFPNWKQLANINSDMNSLIS